MKLTAEEIKAARSENGGWSKETLAGWGIPWPPPKGWVQMLIDGTPIPQPGVDGVAATSVRPSACPEAKLLHEIVMAVIEAGQSDILKSIDSLNEYYGSRIPTVSDVIGGRPKHAIITGDISFDDKVYSFKCARAL
jgi:hypothetical protein